MSLITARVPAADRLPNRRNWGCDTRKIDGKDASGVGYVSGVNAPVVRFDTPPAERKANAQSGSIGASLFEWIEQFGKVRVRDAAAFVLDLDEHALGAGADTFAISPTPSCACSCKGLFVQNHLGG